MKHVPFIRLYCRRCATRLNIYPQANDVILRHVKYLQYIKKLSYKRAIKTKYKKNWTDIQEAAFLKYNKTCLGKLRMKSKLYQLSQTVHRVLSVGLIISWDSLIYIQIRESSRKLHNHAICDCAVLV